MLSHICIGITAFDRAFAFYAPVMEALGYPLRFSDPGRPWAAWMPTDAPRPMFVIMRPFDGGSAEAGNGQMAALLAPSRAAVDQAYAAAMAQGGVCEGPPGLRPQYHPNYYGAYFRDPDGNKLCVCRHDPEPA